jgi:hypothetical protein
VYPPPIRRLTLAPFEPHSSILIREYPQKQGVFCISARGTRHLILRFQLVVINRDRRVDHIAVGHICKITEQRPGWITVFLSVRRYINTRIEENAFSSSSTSAVYQ